MFALPLTLFVAGLLTILLPCIFPLLPIVVGASVSDRHPLRPLVLVLGMIVSFVCFTFLLNVVLSEFVEFADVVRAATFYILLPFGLGFTFFKRLFWQIGAVAGAFFFLDRGWLAVVIAAILGCIAMETGSWIATRLQIVGSGVQSSARTHFGAQSLLTAFIVGATMGLVWAPCTGPALGLVFNLIRTAPSSSVLFLLLCYSIGAGLPLLLVGYGGQWAVHSVRSLSKYTGAIKVFAGVMLILVAIGLHTNALFRIQEWIAVQTGYGELGTSIENKLFDMGTTSATPQAGMKLPVLSRAPEFTGLGAWHNSEPFTIASLKGKVVLVDFWTYSCINCIRTLPYIQGYWEKYKDAPFILIGIHTPEFTFEKSEKNVAKAIKDHGLTYPVAQDNDFSTWSAFSNRYWPAKYLIDAEGRIRYEHFGEGNYEETDEAIASLLAEIGAKGKDEAMPEETQRPRMPITAETYLHSRSWPAFGNQQGDPSAAVLTYNVPSSLELHKYYLVGTWKLVDDERQVLQSDAGEIRIKALAGEVNLVLGNPEGSSVTGTVTVDGKPGTAFTVDHHDLYNLFKGTYGEHEIILRLQGKGLEAFAFTFGS